MAVYKNDRIREILEDENPEALLYDDMDEALIGIYRGDLARQDMREDSIAVYSYVTYIEVLSRNMSEEEAIEYFDFNVAGGYIGKYQPMIIDDTGVGRILLSF